MPRSMWWGDWAFSRPATLSIIDLVESKTLDFKLAGLLWLIMESRPSVLVASAPIFAGKTTLLHSLLDLLPPGIRQYTLKGFAEDFEFADRFKPERTYLVSEEISNHQYEYLWGDQVPKTFRLLRRGYRLGATIHARNVRDVAYLLHSYLEVPLADMARLGIVVTLQAMNGPSYDDDPIRRIDSVSIITMDDKNLVAQMLAVRESLDDDFAYPEETVLREALARKFAVGYDNVSAEVAAREKMLRRMQENGIHTREDVKKAVAEYYRSRLPGCDDRRPS